MKRQEKLNMHPTFESVLMLFSQNYQNFILDETTTSEVGSFF